MLYYFLSTFAFSLFLCGRIQGYHIWDDEIPLLFLWTLLFFLFFLNWTTGLWILNWFHWIYIHLRGICILDFSMLMYPMCYTILQAVMFCPLCIVFCINHAGCIYCELHLWLQIMCIKPLMPYLLHLIQWLSLQLVLWLFRLVVELGSYFVFIISGTIMFLCGHRKRLI